MRRVLALTALLTVFLTTPASASRNIETQPFTNAAPASYLYADALLRAAVADADEWWLSISGQRSEPIDLYVYDKDDYAVAYGEYYTRRVFITREARNFWWDIYSDRRAPLRERRTVLMELWGVMAHERGHNLGVDHQPHGVMDVGVDKALPSRAAEWARKLLPPKRKARR